MAGVDVVAGDRSLTLSWMLPTSAQAALVKWQVGSDQSAVAVAVSTYMIGGLTNGVQYTIRIVPLPSGEMLEAAGTPGVPGNKPVPIPPGPVAK